MSIGVLFVCTGNVCRSPTAEAVLRTLAQRLGLAGTLVIDSAGTSPARRGALPSKLARLAGARRGYDLSALRARRLQADDLSRFDHVIGLDRSHLRHLTALAASDQRARISLLMQYAPRFGLQEVPDPWGGGPADYEYALDLIEAACQGLIDHLRIRHFSE